MFKALHWKVGRFSATLNSRRPYTAPIATSCYSVDSERPHRYYRRPNNAENIDSTPNNVYTLQRVRMLPPSCPFPWVDPDPHLIHRSLDAPGSTYQSHLDRLFCRAHGCDRETDTQRRRPTCFRIWLTFVMHLWSRFS